MAKQLLGKEVTAALNERIKADVAALKEKGINPTLGIIRVGENESDISYERGATKRCETLGVACEKILLPADATQEQVLAAVDKVNKDDNIHGVLLFRPLPKHLNQTEIENALDPAKDVDCMTDGSMSGVFTGKAVGFPPCTPQACMEILDHYGIDCTGKKAVVIGRSLVVGKPAADDADQEECYRNRMPYQDCGYAQRSARGRYPDRGSRPCRCRNQGLCGSGPDCH